MFQTRTTNQFSIRNSVEMDVSGDNYSSIWSLTSKELGTTGQHLVATSGCNPKAAL
jgi:hypothetical protein